MQTVRPRSDVNMYNVHVQDFNKLHYAYSQNFEQLTLLKKVDTYAFVLRYLRYELGSG